MRTCRIEAVIFDFNGTLFRDSAFHDAAWKVFGARHGVSLSPEEFERRVIGFANKEILSYVFGPSLDDAEVLALSREKERIYRGLCLADPCAMVLAPGAVELLDYLKELGTKRAIATASIDENVDFFYREFGLGRWFSREQIVYDDGVLRGKPQPDMFLAAAKAMGAPIDRCMVIEDSVSGLQGAINAGAGRVAAISPSGSIESFEEMSRIDQIVSSFYEIDRTVFHPPVIA